MNDRSSLGFYLLKTTKLVLVPFAVLDVLIFAIVTMQHGLPAAWNELQQLAVPEVIVWILTAFAMFAERRVSNRFAAVQDEIEELKERISQLETHR